MNNQVMNCVEISESGGPDVLVMGQRSIPTPDRNQILIEVAAAGVNRPDVFQRLGQYPAPDGASDIPGLEVSGIVHSIGSDVVGLKVGDSVCALLTGGGYAEFAIADTGSCLKIPSNISLIEAAALPETTFTVWHNVFELGQLLATDSVLIHGGSSGIGTTAIQMAKAHGSEVIVTAGSDEKCQACLDLGADIAINYKNQDFVEVIRNRPQKGVNVILDMVGGDYVPRNLKCLRPDGRLVFIAFLGGSKSEVDFMQVMLKRLTITGSTLRARSANFKTGIADSIRKTVWPWVEGGHYRPRIDCILPLSKASEAHALMENSGHIGKILLRTKDN
ncbi:MAG: NAD(P)H-quinone oxidoreductase [Rhodospirillaceae bacterium]